MIFAWSIITNEITDQADNCQWIVKISAHFVSFRQPYLALVGLISAAPSGNSALPDGGFRLIRPTKAYASVLRRPDKRYAPSGNVSATPVFFIFDMTAMGVVSPLKSANRSVNDKVWTPGMADKGEPRQGQNCREQF